MRLIRQQIAVQSRKWSNDQILCNRCPVRGNSRKSPATPYIVSERRGSAASERRPQWPRMFLTGPRRSTSFRCEVERRLELIARKSNRQPIRDFNQSWEMHSEVAGITKLPSKRSGGSRTSTEVFLPSVLNKIGKAEASASAFLLRLKSRSDPEDRPAQPFRQCFQRHPAEMRIAVGVETWRPHCN
jgi:hypothetical protein